MTIKKRTKDSLFQQNILTVQPQQQFHDTNPTTVTGLNDKLGSFSIFIRRVLDFQLFSFTTLLLFLKLTLFQ